MAVSLNGGTPISHPKCWSFLGKPMGQLGKPTIFGSTTQMMAALASGQKMEVSLPERCREGDTLCLLQRHDETWKVETEGWGK